MYVLTKEQMRITEPGQLVRHGLYGMGIVTRVSPISHRFVYVRFGRLIGNALKDTLPIRRLELVKYDLRSN